MYLLFDIGATKTRIAVSADGKSFQKPIIYTTPKQYKIALQTMADHALELARDKKITLAAGGIAGPLDRDKSRLERAVNIHKSWERKPFTKDLGKVIHAPVLLENDAAVAGLGESVYGAGKNHDIVVYMTVSTGIGGARITHKHIDQSAFGYEPGHQIIDARSKIKCKDCGLYGDLEAFASGASLQSRYKKHPSEITDSRVWKEIALCIAIGLYNTTVIWSPECIVVGGGITLGKKGFFKDLKNEFISLLKIFPKGPVIKRASLGDLGGLYGALVLIRQNKKR